MLSYIRESQSNTPGPETHQDEGGHGACEAESDALFLTVSGREQSVRKSTAFVTSLFIVALIAIVLMAKRSHVQSASASSAVDSRTQIEMAISRVTGVSSEMTGRMDEIVQKFYEFSDVLQVKVVDLNKNPFQLVFSPVETKTKDESQVQDEQVKSLLAQLNAEKGTLSLMSIIQSESSTCCMINGTLLETGQSVDAFVVEEIQADHVRLLWQPDGHIPKALPRDIVTVTLTLKD